MRRWYRFWAQAAFLGWLCAGWLNIIGAAWPRDNTVEVRTGLLVLACWFMLCAIAEPTPSEGQSPTAPADER